MGGALLALLVPITAVLCLYLLTLFRRTGGLAYATSIRMDAVIVVHVLGIGATVMGLLGQRLSGLRHGYLLVVPAAAAEVAFLALNWFGYVWEYEKGAPESLRDSVLRLLFGG